VVEAGVGARIRRHHEPAPGQNADAVGHRLGLRARVAGSRWGAGARAPRAGARAGLVRAPDAPGLRRPIDRAPVGRRRIAVLSRAPRGTIADGRPLTPRRLRSRQSASGRGSQPTRKRQ
jgi:hypothetical protein